MNLEELQKRLTEYVLSSPDNMIRPEYALRKDIVGVQMYAAPLVGCAAADDPWFDRIHNDEKILGETFLQPDKWLPGAKSVISVFYPFTKQVRDSNRNDLGTPSAEWLHGRIEGQGFLNETNRMIASWLREDGAEACVPSQEPAFTIRNRKAEGPDKKPMFMSSWSERHVGFVAGLGTFGLSAHLITRAGKCGRFGSVITTAEFEPVKRPYGDDPFAYCTFCGACVNRCPVNALSLETGKDYLKCDAFVTETNVRFDPRYGCGKCQLNVPCEADAPGK